MRLLQEKRTAGSTGLSSNCVQTYQRVELSKKVYIQKPHTEEPPQAVQRHIALRTWWCFLAEHMVLDSKSRHGCSNKQLGYCCFPPISQSQLQATSTMKEPRLEIAARSKGQCFQYRGYRRNSFLKNSSHLLYNSWQKYTAGCVSSYQLPQIIFARLQL